MLGRRTVRTVAAIASAAAIAAFVPGGDATAYQTFNGHRLTYGVSGQKFWISPSAINVNASAIRSGVALWNATATPISYSETSTQSASRMDFYHTNTSGLGYCGITQWYVNTSQVDPDAQNWWWGKVTLTPELHVATACGSSTHRKAIVAHEQGHVMGLAHAVHSDRIMYTYIASTSVNAPSSDDINGINALY